MAQSSPKVNRSADTTNFLQTGCGPNIEGGIISQCTCRHDIRARWFTSEEWKHKWLAGFTGFSQNKCGASYLFYLIKVNETFPSFKQLYEYYKKSDSTLIESKRTDKHPLGDLYIPKKALLDEHDEDSYLQSHPEHSHKGLNRLKDINFPKYTQKEWVHPTKKDATLLIGDTELSFVWSKPMIKYKGGKAPRARQWSNFEAFCDNLIPVSNIILPKFHR